jgi:uncharacterized membrane protein YkvA (DUF1232 family)
MKKNLYMRSKSFKRAMEKAASYMDNPDLLSGLTNDVKEKIKDIDDNKKTLTEFFEKIRTLIRMIRAYIKGDYKEIPWKSMVLIIGALIYFLMPIDVIPDFIPVAGLLDDISVVLLVFKMINDDINAFIDFEESKLSVVKEPSEDTP